MADASDTRALLLTIQANTELLRSNLSAAERAVKDFTDQTQHHLDDSDARFEKFGQALEKLDGPLEHLKVLGEGAFAFLIGESLIEKGKEALEFAGNIEFMAQQVGVSTKFLQEFRFASSQFGADIEVSDTSLKKFTRSVGEAGNGNKDVIKLFNSLGVSVLDSSGKVRSVEKVYLDTASAIAKIPDPARRAADVFTLFGRGAGALIPLLSQGADGFNQLADAANQLGIVLSPELIEHSEEVNHKLAALKLILDAQMASAIAQNANAIESVASSLVNAAGAVAQFLSKDPARALAILGALAGARVGGAPGAAVGAVAGAAYGESLNDSNNDLAYRRQKYNDAKARVERDRKAAASNDRSILGGLISFHQEGEGSQSDLSQAIHDFQEERARYQRALHAPQPKEEKPDALGSESAGASNPDISHHKKGKSAEELAREAEARRQKELSEDSAFQSELRSANQALAKAKLGLADTAEGQLKVDLESLKDSEATKEQQVDNQVSAGKISAARGEQLKKLYQETEADDEILAQRKAQARTVAEAAAKEALSLQGLIDGLGLDERLATTRAERLKIELQLLALQEKQAILEQQKVIDSQTSTQYDKDIAQAKIDQINAQHGRNVQVVEQQNESPLDAFARELHATADSIKDDFESIEVEGIKSFNDGLADAIVNSKSLGDVWNNVTNQIIADLVKMELQAAESKLFGKGDGSSSSGGGLFSSVLSAIGLGGSGGSNASPLDSDTADVAGFAAGGEPPVGRASLVGERGPELFVPRVPGTIVPNHMLGGGGPTVVQLVVGPGQTFVPAVTAIAGNVSVQTVQQTSAQAARAQRQALGRR